MIRDKVRLLVIPAILALSSGLAWADTLMKIAIEGSGSITVKLHTKEAPKATARIIALAEQGFYNGQKVFEVFKKPQPFLVKMGDPGTRTKSLDDPSIGTGGTGTRIPYEDSGFSNEEGAVGLSTLPRDRDSGDCQFYLLLGQAKFLDGKYTVFGKVTAGMDVLKRVSKGDVITSVTIERD